MPKSGDQGQSGFQDDAGAFEEVDPINDAEKKGKSPEKRAKRKKEVWKDINKSVAEDKRTELNQEIKEDPSKKSLAQRLQEKFKKKKAEKPAEPAMSPFQEAPRVAFDDANKDNQDLEPSENVEDGFTDEAEQAEVVKTEAKTETLDKKALEDRPLDKIASEGVSKDAEVTSPEDFKQSTEKESQKDDAVSPFYTASEKVETMRPGAQPAEEVEVVDVSKQAGGTAIPGNVEVKSPAGQAIPPEAEPYQEDFWEILEQAGISKRKFFLLVIGFISVVIVIIVFLFGGFGIFGGEDDSEPADDDVVEEVEEPKSDEEEDDDVPTPEGDSDQHIGIISSYIFGLEYAEDKEIDDTDFVPLGSLGSDLGVTTSLLLGMEYDPVQQDLVYYIDVLNKMENIYDTDVYSLLDRSADRRMTLNQHLAEMNSLIVEGERIYDEINERLDILQAEYDVVAGDKDFYEDSFYTSIDTLEGEGSYDYLVLFIESSQVAFEVKALFNAYAEISDMFVKALEALIPRYDDILANKEAVIKGIRVFDVPESDIEAIIEVE